jgi:UDP-GlcNAc3NAcA epimerase
MRIVTIVGARPQFIKAAMLSVQLRTEHEEIVVHTGQHYDDNMSDIFFRELGLPDADHNLEVGSGSHGEQTAAMLIGIEKLLLSVDPDVVLVYGDTNSTLAGALTAAKLKIPIAHVEAGLRSFNRDMPEEINRVVTDHLSRWLFAPSEVAVNQLKAEGVHGGLYQVGDIMADCVREFSQPDKNRSDVLERLGLRQGEYAVATVHRAENTDDPDRLRGILQGLGQLGHPVIFSVHPRTKRAIEAHGLGKLLVSPSDGLPITTAGLYTIDPVGYLDMLQLQGNAAVVLTDSGGMQKEAYFLGVPCVTLRDETEWVETVEVSWNRLVGTDPQQIVEAANHCWNTRPAKHPDLYGDGHSAERIAQILGGKQRDKPIVQSDS